MDISNELYERVKKFAKEHTASGDPDAVVRAALNLYLIEATEYGIDGKYRPLTPKGTSEKSPKRKTLPA
jgi:hypothetical protein